jgi:hypothetical protein
MKLTKTFGQLNPDGSASTLNIQVEFDPITNTVTEILHVYAYDERTRGVIDLTGVFAVELSVALETIIRGTDWREEFRLQRPDKKAA